VRALTQLASAALLSAGLSLAATLSGSAAEVWQTLPPTPKLPPAAAEGRIELNGARIWYAEWGQRAPGAPVLLLHGGLANSNYFGHLIPALVDHGYRVVAMDSRGHGRSTRSDAPYSYHLMAEDVVGLLDALHLRKVSVVGWSDGGCIGLDLALNHPDRIARLFAFGANADVSGSREGVEATPVFAAYLRRVPDEYRSLSPTPEQWASFSAAIGKMWETLPAMSASELHTFKVPTTIADGEYEEAIKPEHTRYMAGAIPAARLVILPRVSHFAMLQNPAEFDAAVLEFLHGH